MLIILSILRAALTLLLSLNYRLVIINYGLECLQTQFLPISARRAILKRYPKLYSSSDK